MHLAYEITKSKVWVLDYSTLEKKNDLLFTSEKIKRMECCNWYYWYTSVQKKKKCVTIKYFANIAILSSRPDFYYHHFTRNVIGSEKPSLNESWVFSLEFDLRTWRLTPAARRMNFSLFLKKLGTDELLRILWKYRSHCQISKHSFLFGTWWFSRLKDQVRL